MIPNLFCTVCGNELHILSIENGDGCNLGCPSGHKFYYSPAHLELGDILVIGDLNFQCANDTHYQELLEHETS